MTSTEKTCRRIFSLLISRPGFAYDPDTFEFIGLDSLKVTFLAFGGNPNRAQRQTLRFLHFDATCTELIANGNHLLELPKGEYRRLVHRINNALL